MTINNEMMIPKKNDYIGDEMQDAVNASADFLSSLKESSLKESSYRQTPQTMFVDMFARGIQ